MEGVQLKKQIRTWMKTKKTQSNPVSFDLTLFTKLLLIVFFFAVSLFVLSLLKNEFERSFPRETDNPFGKETVFLGTFSHPNPPFSFKYPAQFEVEIIPDGEKSKAVLFVNPRTGDAFQIYLTPFKDQIVLTPEKIRQDIPDIVLDHFQEIRVSGVLTLFFASQDEVFGDTYEVWFVHHGTLFQITSPAQNVDILKKILVTFRFQK